MLDIVLMCILATSPLPDSYLGDRLPACVKIASATVDAKMDIPLVLSIAWEESKFKMDAVSSAGALGPLQILPRYHCPGGKADGCDLVENGLKAITKYMSKHKVMKEALCHYNGGNVCGKGSKKYANRVIARMKSLSRRSKLIKSKLGVPWIRSVVEKIGAATVLTNDINSGTVK